LDFDPFEEMKNIRDRMEIMYQDFGQQPWSRQQRWGAQQGKPNTDIMDHPDKIIVTIDLPGVDKKDIKLNVDKNMLSINAQRETEAVEEDESYIAHERQQRSYYRNIRLPADVDENKTKATFKNGVLEIQLPKTEKRAGKKINIE